jgi:hypothetical protein
MPGGPGVDPSRGRLHDRDSSCRTQETTLSVTDLVSSTIGVVVMEAVTPALLDITTAVGGQIVASTTLRDRGLSISSTVLGEGALCYSHCQSIE